MIKLYEIGTYTELRVGNRNEEVWYPITWGKYRELTGVPIPQNKNHRSLVLFPEQKAKEEANKLRMQVKMHSFAARG